MAIQKPDVTRLVASECNAFADRFFAAHYTEFTGLTPRCKSEQKPEWFEMYKHFMEESELVIQNALMLWGVTQEKVFEREFVESAQHSQALDSFLALTDYATFIRRMHETAEMQRESDAKRLEDKYQHEDLACRPMTPHHDGATQRRLSLIDQRLAEIEAERNSLLMERRRLVGLVVDPTTVMNLKREIDLQRYHEEIGLD